MNYYIKRINCPLKYITQNQNKFPLGHATPFVEGKDKQQRKYKKKNQNNFPSEHAKPLVKLQDKQQRTC
jgi:hypothetical protein